VVASRPCLSSTWAVSSWTGTAVNLFRQLNPDDETERVVPDRGVQPAWNLQMDSASVRRRVAELSRATVSRRADHAYLDVAGNARRRRPWHSELVTELSDAGRELYAISNFNGEVWPATLRPILACAASKDVVISSFVGVCKPDPRIFELALRRFGVAAEDCLFIDDVAANVAGARAAGSPPSSSLAAALRGLLSAASRPADCAAD